MLIVITPHLLHITAKDSVCSKSFSLAVTNDIAILLSSPPPTKMFQFGGFPILNGITPKKIDVRKSHSAILGSTDVCSSPKLIAAYHDLHRQLKPSHPPDSISSKILK